MQQETKILENAKISIYVEDAEGAQQATHKYSRAQIPTLAPITIDTQFVSEDVAAANIGEGNIALLRSENIGLRQHMADISIPTMMKVAGTTENSLKWLQGITKSRESLALVMQYHDQKRSGEKVIATHTLRSGGVIKNVNFSDAGLEGGCNFTFCGFELTLI